MLGLFDLSFKKFVSPTILKIVYILVMIGIAITYIGMTVAAFDASVGLGVLVLLILGPLASLLYLCLFRVVLEALSAAILTAQNTTELVRLQHAALAPQSAQGPPFPGQQGQHPHQ